MRHDRWQSGVEWLKAAKLSHLKAFLRDGGEVWLGTNSTEPHHTLKVVQCGDAHGRTFASGCQMSAKPTGGGDLELTAKVILPAVQYSWIGRTSITRT